MVTRLMTVSLSELSQSIDSLRKSLKSTIAASKIKSCGEDDRLQEVLIPFIAEAQPPMEKLDRLFADLGRETASLLVYFGEKDGSIEGLFGTILTFAHGLQKAAAEMTRLSVREEADSTKNPKSIDTVSTIDAMSRKLDRHEAMLSAVTIKKPSALHTDLSVSKGFLDVGTMNKGKRTVRGTLSRGELDEAIRSIHGGVRRRERDTLSRGGGVRLSKMFLDGGHGSVRGKDDVPVVPSLSKSVLDGEVFRRS